MHVSDSFYLFLDESGCLGFDFDRSGTSRFFTITVLLVRQNSLAKVKNAVKRTLKNKINNKKQKRKRIKELKGTSTSFSIKSYFYKQMPKEGWKVFSIYIDKRNAYENLKTKQGKKRLYNYLSKTLIDKIVEFLKVKSLSASRISIIVDRSKDRTDIQDFNLYVKTHIEAEMPFETQIYIDHENSEDNPGLQAVDLFCYGCQKQKLYASDPWYNLFKSNLYEVKHF